jgi:hypothetical protein
LAFAIPDAPGRAAFISICPADIWATVLAQPTEAPVAGVAIARHYYRSAGGTVIVTTDAFVPPEVATRLEHEVGLIPE